MTRAAGAGGNEPSDPPAGSGATVTVQQLWKAFGLPPALEARLKSRLAAGDPDVSEFSAFPGAVLAVADVSFTIGPGEVFCIMGLSGSGKSTLVRLINRLIEPTSGSIDVDGTEMTSLSPEALRRVRSEQISMVFQNVALFPHKTIWENVAYPLEVRGVSKRERRQAAEELLELVRLAGWGDRVPAQLSGGMQQRVGIARALAASPKLLLMDEPFSALDPLIRRELQDEFLDIMRRARTTTIFITHDFDEAVYVGHRIAIMRAGRFEQVDAPREVIFSPRNDYVARFISAEAVIAACCAADVMTATRADGDRLAHEGAPTCSPGTRVVELLPLFRDGVNRIHVERDGTLFGTISQDDIVARIGAILMAHKAASIPEGNARSATA